MRSAVIEVRSSAIDIRRTAHIMRRMSRRKHLTAADVCEITGYSRNQLRGVLDELPPWRDQIGPARVAREFNAQDLIVLSVVHALETTYAIRRNAVANLMSPLRAALAGPKPVNREAKLLLSILPPSVRYIKDAELVGEGLVVPLLAFFERVDHYRRYDMPGGHVDQADLKLGPTIISNRKKQRMA